MQDNYHNPDYFDKAAAAIPATWHSFKPTLGVILGSGWSRAVMGRPCIDSLPFSAIPGYGDSTIQGHAGEIRLIETEGNRAIVFCGRRHYYEGAGWGPAVMPVEIMRRLGVKRLLLTNAAGGINQAFNPGDLMVITDHINTASVNPLIGTLREGWGTRFPDQSNLYTKTLRDQIATCAQTLKIQLHQGIYAYTTGPCFETPAEIRAYKNWGADAVGMSTVPEAIVAGAIGMQVAALSCITNMAAGINPNPLTHQEVMEATTAAMDKMDALLYSIMACHN